MISKRNFVGGQRPHARPPLCSRVGHFLPGSVPVTDVEGAQGRVLFVVLFPRFRLARRGDSGLIRLGIQGDSG